MKILLFFYKVIRVFTKPFAVLNSRLENKINAYYQKQEQNVIIPIFPNRIERDGFFEKINLITHAGGGISGLAYLNCEQAFYHYYENGNKVFEYDVVQKGNGEYSLAHDQMENNGLIDGRFKALTIEKCFNLLKANNDLIVIFDCKFNDLTDFANYVKNNLDETALDRVVIQVFSEENISQVRKAYDFKMLFVCMMDTDYLKAVDTCIKHKIGAVSISDKAIKERSGYQVFEKNNICSFIYTVNTSNRFKEIKELGMTGVFSDFLLNVEVKE